MNNSTRITLFALIAVALLGVGYGVGCFSQPESPTSAVMESKECPACPQCSEKVECPEPETIDDNGGFQAGWDAAKARLEETGFYIEPEEVKEINGEIVSLSNGQLEVRISPITPLDSKELDTRIIKIENGTEILLKKERNFEEFEKEMKAYEKKMQKMMEKEEFSTEELEAIGDAPDIFVTEKNDVSILKQGAFIQIKTEGDIRNEKSFTAQEINIDENALKILEEMEKIEEEMSEASIVQEELYAEDMQLKESKDVEELIDNELPDAEVETVDILPEEAIVEIEPSTL